MSNVRAAYPRIFLYLNKGFQWNPGNTSMMRLKDKIFFDISKAAQNPENHNTMGSLSLHSSGGEWTHCIGSGKEIQLENANIYSRIVYLSIFMRETRFR